MGRQAGRTAATSLRDNEKAATRAEGSRQRVAGGKTSQVRTAGTMDVPGASEFPGARAS